MKVFLDWLITEAGAGWIIGILGLIAGFYTWLRRERPPRVVIQEIENIRLLNVHPSQQENLSVHFVDERGEAERIESLEQKELVIYNNGTKDILQSIELSLAVCEEDSKKGFSGFWRLIFDDDAGISQVVCDNTENAWTGVHVEVPYLNSYPVHKHYVKAYLISERGVRLDLLKGVGKGWSAYLVSFKGLREFERRVTRLLSGATVILLTLLLVVFCFLFFNSPLLRVYFRPTPENIEAALRTYETDFEVLRTSGFFSLHYFQFAFARLGGQTFFFAYALLLAMTLFVGRQKKFGAFIAERCLRVQPKSRFQEAPSQPDRRNRLLEAIEGLLE